MARTELKGKVAGPSGRPPLEPEHPLPVRVALLQLALLIGVPLALLLALRPILRSYFPELGY